MDYSRNQILWQKWYIMTICQPWFGFFDITITTSFNTHLLNSAPACDPSTLHMCNKNVLNFEGMKKCEQLRIWTNSEEYWQWYCLINLCKYWAVYKGSLFDTFHQSFGIYDDGQSSPGGSPPPGLRGNYISARNKESSRSQGFEIQFS